MTERWGGESDGDGVRNHETSPDASLRGDGGGGEDPGRSSACLINVGELVKLGMQGELT